MDMIAVGLAIAEMRRWVVELQLDELDRLEMGYEDMLVEAAMLARGGAWDAAHAMLAGVAEDLRALRVCLRNPLPEKAPLGLPAPKG